jgi:hypothetical protein
VLASATRRIPGSALPRCASPEALAFRTFTGRVDHVPEMHGVVLLESTLVPQFLAIFVDVGSFEEPQGMYGLSSFGKTIDPNGFEAISRIASHAYPPAQTADPPEELQPCGIQAPFHAYAAVQAEEPARWQNPKKAMSRPSADQLGILLLAGSAPADRSGQPMPVSFGAA